MGAKSLCRVSKSTPDDIPKVEGLFTYSAACERARALKHLRIGKRSPPQAPTLVPARAQGCPSRSPSASSSLAVDGSSPSRVVVCPSSTPPPRRRLAPSPLPPRRMSMPPSRLPRPAWTAAIGPGPRAHTAPRSCMPSPTRCVIADGVWGTGGWWLCAQGFVPACLKPGPPKCTPIKHPARQNLKIKHSAGRYASRRPSWPPWRALTMANPWPRRSGMWYAGWCALVCQGVVWTLSSDLCLSALVCWGKD